MTVREALLSEIDRAPDEVLGVAENRYEQLNLQI